MQNFLFFLFLLCFPIHGTPQVVHYPYRLCSKATFSPNSTYLTNLNLLSSALSSNASRRLYYNASVGRPPDHSVYGHFQCRGDVNASACQDCVTSATSNTSQQYCPLSTGAVIWFDECLLRYSSKSFFSSVATQPSLILINSEEIELDVDRFDKLVVSTLSGAADRATNASLDRTLMFATQEAEFENETIYALAQCSGDLSRSNCGECLRDAVNNFPTCCKGKKGGRVLVPSCTVRYELYAFYNSVTSSTAPASTRAPSPSPSVPGRGPPPPSASASGRMPSVADPLSGRSRISTVIVIGIVVASLLSH